MKNKEIQQIIECLKTVYDPEFPMIDLYTLGLIYDTKINKKTKIIDLIMTYTTPSCPMGEMLQQLCKNAINEKFPDYIVEIEITFDPMRKISNIKDKDLQKLFTQ
ncbi:MAG TPA: metal-sulfur cluster assembly factor [Candidatus Absconditabacterales bacterium]|nr:metal-sulfur cluster assembly factor [Candidatus Absconditabacterales bacterium]